MEDVQALLLSKISKAKEIIKKEQDNIAKWESLLENPEYIEVGAKAAQEHANVVGKPEFIFFTGSPELTDSAIPSLLRDACRRAEHSDDSESPHYTYLVFHVTDDFQIAWDLALYAYKRMPTFPIQISESCVLVGRLTNSLLMQEDGAAIVGLKGTLTDGRMLSVQFVFQCTGYALNAEDTQEKQTRVDAIFNPQYTGAVVLETNTLSPAMKDVLLQRVYSSCVEDDASVIVI